VAVVFFDDEGGGKMQKAPIFEKKMGKPYIIRP
jgi:hypothetical protein